MAKVAKIVGQLLDEFDQTFAHLPYVHLQATMQQLEDMGEVDINGDVWSLRYSEIRLANQKSSVEPQVNG